MNSFRILTGHFLEQAKLIRDASIHACVTSPPYWRLRDYKTEPQVWGGDPSCEHEWTDIISRNPNGSGGPSKKQDTNAGSRQLSYKHRFHRSATCARCSAWLGELGQEPTPDLFIEHLVMVFREVHRVLRPDGTCWINISDSYHGDSPLENRPAPFREKWDPDDSAGNGGSRRSAARIGDIKPKDLVGIPWMLAMALRKDGWWLRRDNIWLKTAAMPESVLGWRWERCRRKTKPCSAPNTGGIRGVNLLEERGGWTKDTHPESRQPAEYENCPGCAKCRDNDGLVLRRGAGRPTTVHEYVFMLTKSENSYFDSDAIAEPQSEDERARRLRELEEGLETTYKFKTDGKDHGQAPNMGCRTAKSKGMQAVKGTRNKRSVWKIPEDPAGMLEIIGDWITFQPEWPALLARLADELTRDRTSVWRIDPEPHPEDHFAAYPSELPSICIKASTSEHGCCADCGAPYARIIERIGGSTLTVDGPKGEARDTQGMKDTGRLGRGAGWREIPQPVNLTKGWRRTCSCKTTKRVSAVVLDPFLGRGTTGVAAIRLGRDFVGCELQATYVPMARKNIHAEAPLFVQEILSEAITT